MTHTSPLLAPINKLPPEILTQILVEVSRSQRCRVFRSLGGQHHGFELHYPEYPEALMAVCSFWRHAVITCPRLWTHIDVALNHYLNPRLLARARTCVARAGRLPLHIHICDAASEIEHLNWIEILDCRRANSRGLANSQGLAPDYSTSGCHRSGWCGFEVLGGHQDEKVPIKSLELDAVIFGDAKDYQLAAVAYFFARCRPDAFTQYTARIRNEDYDLDHVQFIEPIDSSPPTPGVSRLPIPGGLIERIWLRVHALRVNGLCPPWTSRAYHGLTELHIGEGVPELHQSQLVHILRSSPGLRVLRLDIDTVGDCQLPAPILLKDLEQLSLISGSWFSMGPSEGPDPIPRPSKVLQLISPGSNPLQLTFFGFPGNELVDFVSRSNVARLFIKAWGRYDITTTIRQCPELQTLVLEDCGIDEKYELNLGVPNCEEVRREGLQDIPMTRINVLYLVGFRQHCYEQLRGIVERYSIQKLIICGTELWHEGTSPSSNPRMIESKLSAITLCPMVQYFESGEVAIDWD